MKHYIIGELLENGEILKADSGQGVIYKDTEAFYSKSDKVCYVPETSDCEYSYKDFLDIANGSEEVAEHLFDICEGQTPELQIEDYLNEDEANCCINCNKIYLSYDVNECPYCGQSKVDKIIKNDNIIEYFYTRNEGDNKYKVTIFTKPLEEMNWSFESLFFPENNETFAIVEDLTNKNKTYLSTHGAVKIINTFTDEELSTDDIKRLALEIYDSECYEVANNNWFCLEYCVDNNIIEDDVFEAVPNTCNELADLLLKSHIAFFNTSLAY